MAGSLHGGQSQEFFLSMLGCALVVTAIVAVFALKNGIGLSDIVESIAERDLQAPEALPVPEVVAIPADDPEQYYAYRIEGFVSDEPFAERSDYEPPNTPGSLYLAASSHSPPPPAEGEPAP